LGSRLRPTLRLAAAVVLFSICGFAGADLPRTGLSLCSATSDGVLIGVYPQIEVIAAVATECGIVDIHPSQTLVYRRTSVELLREILPEDDIESLSNWVTLKSTVRQAIRTYFEGAAPHSIAAIVEGAAATWQARMGAAGLNRYTTAIEHIQSAVGRLAIKETFETEFGFVAQDFIVVFSPLVRGAFGGLGGDGSTLFCFLGTTTTMIRQREVLPDTDNNPRVPETVEHEFLHAVVDAWIQRYINAPASSRSAAFDVSPDGRALDDLAELLVLTLQAYLVYVRHGQTDVSDWIDALIVRGAPGALRSMFLVYRDVHHSVGHAAAMRSAIDVAVEQGLVPGL